MTSPDCDAVPDPTVAPVAVEMLECLAGQMARVPNPPQVTCLRPGDRIDLLLSTERDECCEGLAWVRAAGFYPSRNFPAPDDTVVSCGVARWAVVLELGAARCAPVGDDRYLPTCDDWTTVTQRVLADAAAMRRALCCFRDLDIDRLWLAGPWTPLTTEGGCVGGTMQVTVSAPACDCVEDGS